MLPRLATIGQRYKSFGPLESFEPLQRRVEGLNLVHRYLVKFHSQSIEFDVAMDEQKKISNIRAFLKY